MIEKVKKIKQKVVVFSADWTDTGDNISNYIILLVSSSLILMFLIMALFKRKELN